MPKSFLLSLNCNNKSILYSIQQQCQIIFQKVTQYKRPGLYVRTGAGRPCTGTWWFCMRLSMTLWPNSREPIQTKQNQRGRKTYLCSIVVRYFIKKIWNKNICLKCRFNTDLYEPAFLYIFLHNYIETVKKSYLK